MMSTPPRMVIQQNMERIASFYHASASIQPANHSDFFNSHRRLHSKPNPVSSMSAMGISRQERALCISDCSNEDKRITSRLKALRRGHECVREGATHLQSPAP